MKNMKQKYSNRILSLVFGVICLGITSCDFLAFDESVGYDDPQEMTNTFTKAEQSLTHVYSYLPTGYSAINGAMRECATDDAVYVWSQGNVNTYFNGSWSPKNTVDEYWSHLFSAIRAANFFLEYIEGEEFERYKWNNTYATMQEKMQYWESEARFLRSFYLFELARRYGDVAIPTELYTLENVNEVKPSSFNDVISFIKSECDSIAPKLPDNYASVAGAQTGRVTKGAAMALKCRALLYNASPLFSADDQNKWKAAALAAKAIIDGGTYQLVKEDVVNNLGAKGLIFERREGTSTSFEQRNYPVGFDGAKGGTCPSQNLVDAFERTDGAKVTLKSDGWYANDVKINAADAYKNRDPRFYKTIVHNNQIFKGRYIESFTNGNDGLPKEEASPTGYYLNKYIIENIDIAPTPTPEHHTWVYFRYAEILLNYAEALNEAYGADYTDATFTLSARAAINMVRNRVDMPSIPAGLSKADFRTAVHHERRVELAFENHRFWDVRRWKTAENTSQDLLGASIEKVTENVFNYTLKTVQARTWNNKYYLYPIPQNERYKNDNLKQNPLWD